MGDAATLTDTFGRLHDNLRISVTARCNIRCFSCMPEHPVDFVRREEILSFEELERFVRIAIPDQRFSARVFDFHACGGRLSRDEHLVPRLFAKVDHYGRLQLQRSHPAAALDRVMQRLWEQRLER